MHIAGVRPGRKPANHAAVRSLFFGPHWAVPVFPATSTFSKTRLMRRSGAAVDRIDHAGV